MMTNKDLRIVFLGTPEFAVASLDALFNAGYNIVGGGQVIKGFDLGVMGMQVGDKRTVEIEVLDAYGEKNDDMVVEFPKEQFPADMKPEVGMQLMMNNGEGQSFPVVVKEVREESVLLDANHPLAGEDLIFDIELVEIITTSRIIMP